MSNQPAVDRGRGGRVGVPRPVLAHGLTVAQCDQALQFVAADGRVYSAQDAVAQLLVHSGGAWRAAGLALRLPGVNPVAGVVYRWVARNRSRLPGGSCSSSATVEDP